MSLESLSYFLAGTLAPSFAVAYLAALVVRRIAPAWGLVDQPGPRKVHAAPTPLGGGLAIWLGVLLPFAAGELALYLVHRGVIPSELVPEFAREHLPGLAAQSGKLAVLLLAGTLLMLLGLADDRRGLDWRLRLAAQFLVAGICVATQGWRLTAFIDLPLLTGFLSVVWIVGLINSFNMLDNMDGLSAGVAAIASSMLAAVLLISPDPTTNRPQLFVAGLLLVLVGALAGFLVHNRPPARLFMGDAGSYFVGFIIAVATLLSTYVSYQSTTRHAILAPVLVLAVPLYDMTSVLLIRLREGRSPFQADKSHFSHRLIELGLTKTQAVLVIYLATAACGVGALLLHRVDAIGAGVIVLGVLSLLAVIAMLEFVARRKSRE